MKTLREAIANRSNKQNKIEDIKALKRPMSVYESLSTLCANGVENLPSEDTAYFFKCFGLFLKKDNTFMLRIRIPAGQLTSKQAIVIGEVAKTYGNDYIDITTRQQIELRFLALENLPTILRTLDSVGISTFQTGIDNFRNIVTSSFDGVGEGSIIDCKPIIDQLQSLFFKKEEWIGALPRKFNTAILGSLTNDCNIYGHDCSFILASKDDKVGFNLYLGGKVGVQASDTGLFVCEEQVTETFAAIIELFKTYGFRDNRNKNRLHFLLEAVGMDVFVEAIKASSGLEYLQSGDIMATQSYSLGESGVYALSASLRAVHFSVPSGVFSGSDLIGIGELAREHDAQLRLSVEQSLYLITDISKVEQIQSSELFEAYRGYNNTYFNHQIACAGMATCAFGVIPNKPDAIEMAHFLSREVPIADGKVRMYWSGCVKGCGIHGIADIGFEGCKAKDAEGNTCYGVHIFLGGKATKEAREARILYKSIPLTEAKYLVRDLMIRYRDEREIGESFEDYDDRVLSHLSVEEIVG